MIESEKNMDRYLARIVREDMGGLYLKYHNGGEVGYPDRIIILPEGKMVWVELKSRGKIPSKMQTHQIGKLRRRGQTVFVVDSEKSLKELLRWMKL